MIDGSELSRAAAGPAGLRLWKAPRHRPARLTPDPGVVRPTAVRSGASALLRAAAIGLFLLLHPYGGLIQDARIYVGRGVADRDIAGVGQDLVFRGDAQTGFSLMRLIVDGLLHVATPQAASMLLALAGSLLWMATCWALLRRVAASCLGEPVAERAAFAMAVAVAALPGHYGAFAVFAYAETVATPRLFAEAAALGGLSALLGGRRLVGAGSLLLASALHPIMALPALMLGAVVAVRWDRRWIGLAAAVAAGLVLAAALGLPVADRLLSCMDPDWAASLRQRSPYLFPTIWPAADLAAMAPKAAALAVAGMFGPPPARRLLWGAVGVALTGLAASLVLGDWFMDTLVVQLQPWRALWLLSVLGNAGFALAVLSLARRGVQGGLAIAVLLLAWSCGDAAATILLSVAAVALCAAAQRGAFARVDPKVVLAAAVLAGAAVLIAVAQDAAALILLLRSASTADGQATWALTSALGVQAFPLVLGALAVAARRDERRPSAALAAAALVALAAAAALLWDQRTAERRGFEDGAGMAELRDFFGPERGAVLWIDENAESWFALGRPAFFNALQGAPTLFSRDMASEWTSRAKALQDLGLIRARDLAPWTSTDDRREDLHLTPDAIRGFCADLRRPAGLVAPGDQAAAVPPGFALLVWRPPFAIRHLSVDGDGLAWRRIRAFTAVRCG